MDYTDELADRAEVLAVKQTLKWGSNSMAAQFLAMFAKDLRARHLVINDPQIDLSGAFWHWYEYYKAKTRS